jgi:glycosyltransferase involved in cell wall biosynthesis
MISIILPAFNEAGFLGATVKHLLADLADNQPGEQREAFEIIVAENGSSDATLAEANALAAEHPEVRVVSIREANYGKALRAGFLAATGEIVTNFDVDFYDLDFMWRAIDRIRSGAPDAPVIVVASKRGEGSNDTRPFGRRLVTGVFSTILRFGFGLTVSDTHGMKSMRREPLVASAEACKFGTDLFDTELILRAERAGFHCSEIGVTVIETRPSRTPMWKRVPRSLRGLARLRWALWREFGFR